MCLLVKKDVQVRIISGYETLIDSILKLEGHDPQEFQTIHSQKEELLTLHILPIAREAEAKRGGTITAVKIAWDKLDFFLMEAERENKHIIVRQHRDAWDPTPSQNTKIGQDHIDVQAVTTESKEEIKSTFTNEDEIKMLSDSLFYKAPEGEPATVLATGAIDWWKEFSQTVSQMKLTFGKELKESTQSEFPPGDIVQDKETKKYKIFLPSTKPDDEVTSKAMGCIINTAMLAGIELKESNKPDLTAGYYIVIRALADEILGAYNCVRQDVIEQHDNVPKIYRKGWEFVLWHAFKQRAKINDGLGLLKITKTEKITPDGVTSWAEAGKVAIVTRLHTLFKMAAQNRSGHLGPPVRFFKSKKFIQDKVVGKKPVEGMTHGAEHVLLVEEYEKRLQVVSRRYDSINWESMPPDGLNAIYKEMTQVPKSQEIKNIEDCENQRVTPLIIEVGRGRNAVKRIVKGQTLFDKLIAINGGKNVRVIGSVMWSPLTNITKDSFISNVMKVTQLENLVRQGKTNENSENLKRVNEFLYNHISHREIFDSAVACYTSLLDDNAGEPSWCAAFGIPVVPITQRR